MLNAKEAVDDRVLLVTHYRRHGSKRLPCSIDRHVQSSVAGARAGGFRARHAPIAPLRASSIAPGSKKGPVRFLFRSKEVRHEFKVELSELRKET